MVFLGEVAHSGADVVPFGLNRLDHPARHYRRLGLPYCWVVDWEPRVCYILRLTFIPQL